VTPDPTEYADVLRQLITSWQAPGSEISIEPRNNSATTGIVVFCLTSHVYTLAQAVQALYDADHAVASVSLIRQMIECAVTAMWTELAGEAGSRILLHQQSRSVRTAYKEYVNAGMPADASTVRRMTEEIDKSFDGSGPTRAAATHFEQLCKEVVGGDFAYATYRTASAISHASMSVADLYLDDRDIADPSETPFVVSTSPAEYAPGSWLGMALMMTMHATSAWSRVDTTRKDEATMRVLHARFGTAYEAHFTPAGLEKQAQRERELLHWRGAEG
jgi:Family of unknown function (DUF5677)